MCFLNASNAIKERRFLLSEFARLLVIEFQYVLRPIGKIISKVMQAILESSLKMK